MEDQRKARAIGSELVLGGICYRLDGVEGCGSSAIVYRATYTDSLNRDSLHQVLIKELFPFSAWGGIDRDQNGDIVCTDAARDIMLEAQRRFRMGNQVNLDLLRQIPASISGNLNSYEAHGTYYSVLSVHGGENLLQRLETRQNLSVRESARVLSKLLHALECFHRHGLLHLDISPDNILLLPEQVLLIDFNSVWDTRNPPEEFAFSRKEGYSAPEVLLQQSGEIGPATDLYACCAVFFHMLSGRRLLEEESRDGLRRGLAKALPCLAEIPQTAAAKAAEILLKGLHTLPRRRYQSTAELQQAVAELLARLDGFGVTKSALWEAAAGEQKKQRSSWSYLEQPVQRGQQSLCREQLTQELAHGGKFLLTGAGGMGKTRLLLELCGRCTARYHAAEPVFVYLSLRGYQACSNDTFFLRRTLLQLLRFPPEHPQYHDALHSLHVLFDQTDSKGQASVVLLLDGLNEAGTQRKMLLAEIEELCRCKGVGLLLTDRTDAVMEYALRDFVSLSLSPLQAQQIDSQFTARGLAPPESQRLRQLLTTPMLLFLYLESAEPTDNSTPETQQALLALYLQHFYLQTLREDSGDQNSQLINRYLLRHFLPQVAWEMHRQGRTILSVASVRRLAEKSFRALRGRRFGTAFSEYLGKSRRMLEGIARADEWFDLAVRERLIDRFGLLADTAQGQIALFHDDFLPVLVQQAEENRHLAAKNIFMLWRRRIAVIAAAAILLGVAGAGMIHSSLNHFSYTAAESACIYDALSALNASLSTWSNRVSAQTELLERAALSDILDNRDPLAREQLQGLLEQKRQFLSALYAPRPDSAVSETLEQIAEKKELFSPQTLSRLLERCAAMEAISEAALSHLEQALCTSDSLYNTRDKRERVVNAHRTYLEAETRYVSFLLASLLSEMTPEQQGEILKAMTYMEALEGFYDGPGSVEPDRLADGTLRALETVKDAQREMTLQGFSILWPDEQNRRIE